MNFSINLTLLSIFLATSIFCSTTVKARKSGHSRPKRIPELKPKNKHVHKYLNKGATVDCFDAFDVCRKNKKCRSALHGLNKKCQVTFNRCQVEGADLPKCGKLMDHLFLYGFSENKCKCVHNLERCFDMFNKIYANPCFAAVRKQRKEEKEKAAQMEILDSVAPDDLKALTPQLELLRDRKTGILLLDEENNANNTENNNNDPTVEIKEFELEEIIPELLEEEPIFGDEGFAKPPPRRNSPSATPKKPLVFTEIKKNSELLFVSTQTENSNEDNVDSSTGKTIIELNEEVIQLNGENQGEKREVILLENVDANESQSAEDNSDVYRAVGIALGLTLGISIFVAVIYLTLKRAKATLLYKNGKVMRKGTENGGSSSRLKSDSSLDPSRA